ncbi:unnamed protein product [Rotaria sp. Silwood1]|nr:unnamed protein product [Rotaria sp. Silwood1]CAF1544811.1 unnamed protein product [Rotaria sp. Silwood1]
MDDQKLIKNVELIGHYEDSTIECYNELEQSTQTKNKNSSKLLPTTNKQPSPTVVTSHQQTMKQGYELPPLILEGVSLSRVALNNFLVKKIPELKCNNIMYNDKRKNFTIYPSTIASYNALLTRLSLNELSDTAKIFIPRSIQRIQKTDKEAFVKSVDKEISIQEIQNALTYNGYQVNQVERLMNKEKTGTGTTIKITFDDVKNRDAFIKLGLQIDHMHFPAEKAKQKINPQQCHSCYRFGHIAKYCKQQQLICSYCAGPHRYNVCDQKQLPPKCSNCQGSHEATSHDCPKYINEQKRIQTAIDRYSYSSTSIHHSTPVPDSHDIKNYPLLSSTNSIITSQTLNSITEACTMATMKAIENISNKLITIFTKKMNELIYQFSSKYQLPIDVTMDCISCETNPDSDTEEKEKDPDYSLEISTDQNQLAAVNDEMVDINELTHANTTHKNQQSTTMNNNGVKRTSNIDSPTTYKPKRTNNTNQSTTIKITKSKTKSLVI